MPITGFPEDEDPKRAQIYFDRGKLVAQTGNFEYAIEMYIQGLSFDPDNVAAHQALRDIALQRKARGEKDMGMMNKMMMPRATGDRQAMLNAEKLLAYSPADINRMTRLLRAANAAGFSATVAWIGPILLRANEDQRR